MYSEVRHAAETLAGRLEYAGIERGARVAVCASDHFRWAVSVVAVFLRHALLIPVEWRLSSAEQQARLMRSRSCAVITEWSAYRRWDGSFTGHIFVADVPPEVFLPAGVERWAGARSEAEVRATSRQRAQYAIPGTVTATWNKPF